MLMIHYANGQVRRGVVLSLQGDRVRAAVPDMDDVFEFRLINGAWVSEDREPVTFQFPLQALEAVGLPVPPVATPSQNLRSFQTRKAN